MRENLNAISAAKIKMFYELHNFFCNFFSYKNHVLENFFINSNSYLPTNLQHNYQKRKTFYFHSTLKSKKKFAQPGRTLIYC